MWHVVTRTPQGRGSSSRPLLQVNSRVNANRPREPTRAAEAGKGRLALGAQILGHIKSKKSAPTYRSAFLTAIA
jgi:hypothetical protein